MPKKEIAGCYQMILDSFSHKHNLKNVQLSKKTLSMLLQKTHFKSRLQDVALKERVLCLDILEVCRPVMNALGQEPEGGWLPGIYTMLVNQLYPEGAQHDLALSRAAAYFYLIVLRVFLNREGKRASFDEKTHFQFATPEEVENSPTASAYRRFLELLKETYVYELMRLGREIKPFDMLGHVTGVHHIAMHMARQLVKLGVQVDLPLVSAAAASHDIGKYGCRGNEIQRIPYLHYYYTEEWLKRHDLEVVSHVAANHSTWDLELENLPVESLLLIYADFRVKSRYDQNMKEQMLFYTLRDSYDVILSKLDNVDEFKRKRYKRVYAKLHDFEQYMIALGANTDPYASGLRPPRRMEAALLNVNEAVQGLRFQAISHNIRLMHKISSDTSFVDLLEDAMGEKNWNNIRTYIDIFEEYFTYMTQKQKQLTMRYLYELFMHSQGDIRSQAASLYGRILAGYDIVYRKELPPDKRRPESGPDSVALWQEALTLILTPDHKLAPQHRAWINYTLKAVLLALLENSLEAKKEAYLQAYFNCFAACRGENDQVAFVLLDSILRIPVEFMSEEQLILPLQVAKECAADLEPRMQAAALRLCLHILQQRISSGQVIALIQEVISVLPQKKDIAISYLLLRNYEHMEGETALRAEIARQVQEADVADLFLENLKTATAWVVKEINIELLLYRVQAGNQAHTFQVATHFANLIRVSERFAVRHRAGRALVSMAPLLTLDQRNEIAVELTRGLENATYEFSKYIPQYLGQFLLYLHPKELDEVLLELQSFIKSPNELAACVTLPTIGVLLEHYDEAYMRTFSVPAGEFAARKTRMLSMLVGGLAHYSDIVSREAFLVIGKQMFGGKLPFPRKNELFGMMHKKLLLLLEEQTPGTLAFFNNAASLNHLYRYIVEAWIDEKTPELKELDKVAFFPGTFDPFSSSHKGIVQEMSNLGYEVYLALDEFSWSKRTQPHMIRRRIVNMSVADEFGVYLFPDDITVNLTNETDLQKLKSIFSGRDVYIAVGSDVVRNASAYKAPATQHSIHGFHHIVFLRNMEHDAWSEEHDIICSRLRGNIHELSLPAYLEDVSSTRIRDNIDHNRDISTLVDPVAQGYIYDHGFYLREPQYKEMLRPETIYFQRYESSDLEMRAQYMELALLQNPRSAKPMEVGRLADILQTQLYKPKSQLLSLFRKHDRHLAQGIACFYATSAEYLLDEFQDVLLAEFARRHMSGRIAVLAGIYVRADSEQYDETMRLLITEVLAECLKQDYTYALYIEADGLRDEPLNQALERQGFQKLPGDINDAPVYAVDMRSPIALIEDVQSRIKAPLSNDEAVLRVLSEAQKSLASSMTKLYPGRLVISFDAGLMNHLLVSKIQEANHVKNLPPEARQYGACMCVPYGKTLRGVVVPNTVTKSLHVDKTYMPDMNSFLITRYPGYSSLMNQVRTIKSFNRPVLLVDDLLHKGYRLEALDPLFKEADLDIRQIIVGVLSGRGKDLMSVQGRQVESVYFIPNLRYWFVDSMLYPFLGGDSVFRERNGNDASNLLPSVNQIFPYTSPAFISGASQKAIFDLSLTCLNNAYQILRALEQRHQEMFGFNLTLNRMGDAMQTARVPDKGRCMHYDRNLAPSVYVENDIEMLFRLEGMLKT